MFVKHVDAELVGYIIITLQLRLSLLDEFLGLLCNILCSLYPLRRRLLHGSSLCILNLLVEGSLLFQDLTVFVRVLLVHLFPIGEHLLVCLDVLLSVRPISILLLCYHVLLMGKRLVHFCGSLSCHVLHSTLDLRLEPILEGGSKPSKLLFNAVYSLLDGSSEVSSHNPLDDLCKRLKGVYKPLYDCLSYTYEDALESIHCTSHALKDWECLLEPSYNVLPMCNQRCNKTYDEHQWYGFQCKTQCFGSDSSCFLCS